MRSMNHDDHAPDREQRVADRVGDGVAERRHLALGLSHTMPSAAVVVRAPAQTPNRIARIEAEEVLADEHRQDQRDAMVATMPHRNRLIPCVCNPLTNPGPAEMPTMAMKTLSPTEFMNHTVDDGMRPKVGRTERSQPKTRPGDQRAAGGGQRQRHAAHLAHQRADQRAERDRAADEGDVGDVARTVGHAQVLGGGRGVLRRPTSVRMSPRWIFVLGRIGIEVATAPRVI